ncbi:hypothetical protein XENTR_v10001096 [Xenopus tropicalis]|nr:hypothetical protein XENTR_v10001096 [Xenopus tropicalis]
MFINLLAFIKLERLLICHKLLSSRLTLTEGNYTGVARLHVLTPAILSCNFGVHESELSEGASLHIVTAFR